MSGGKAVTEAELLRLEALANAATPGLWVVEARDREGKLFVIGDDLIVSEVCMEGDGSDLSDARFIADSREAVPVLIDEVRRLRAGVKQLQEDAHQTYTVALFQQDPQSFNESTLAHMTRRVTARCAAILAGD